MEDECRNLDLQIIFEENLNTTNTCINSCKTLQKLQKEIQKLTDELPFLNNAIFTQIQVAASNEEQIQSLHQKRIISR